MRAWSLKDGVTGSLALHLGLAIFLIARMWVFPSAYVPYVATLKVDLVDLPDLTKQEMERISQGKSEKKEKQKNNPADLILKNRNQRKEKIQGALDRIKALSQVESEIEAPEKIKGNQISKGSALSGEAKENAQASYYDLVLEKIRANWSLPVWIARQSLSAQVLLRIGPDGLILSQQFIRRSGNAAFDDAVLEAIQRSQPFSKPPADFLSSVAKNGILFGFPL